VFGKHVENQHRAVDDRHIDRALEILALAGPQVVEYQDQLGLAFLCKLADLSRFSASDQRRRIDVRAPLDDALDDPRAGRFG
jgi:hypothetical protein